MKKINFKKVLTSLSLLMLLGCGINGGTKEESMKLTKEELKVAGDNKKKILEILLSKASYKEAFKSVKDNKEEKEKLEALERGVVNDYYILSKAGEKVKVTKEEIKEIYDANKKDLNGKKLEEVSDAIENLIGRAKLKDQLSKEILIIKDKYKIGEGLSKEEIEKQRKELDIELSKAIYKEANENFKSKKQKEEMTVLKRRKVNDYYILTEAKKNVKVTEEEIKEVYENNKKDLEGKKLEEVHQAIENLIYENKVKAEVTNVLKKINEKYDIDKIVEGYLAENPKK